MSSALPTLAPYMCELLAEWAPNPYMCEFLAEQAGEFLPQQLVAELGDVAGGPADVRIWGRDRREPVHVQEEGWVRAGRRRYRPSLKWTTTS
ncbi:hypothetical protein BH23ACT9_BH23ACT9_32540 [soil metagenome]